MTRLAPTAVGERLAAVAADLVTDPGSKRAKEALYLLLLEDLAPRLAGYARREFGWTQDAEDVASTLWSRLQDPRHGLLQQIADGTIRDPEAWLWTDAINDRFGWLRTDAGRAGALLEEHDVAGVEDACGVVAESSPIVVRSLQTLLPRTPEHLQDAVSGLVVWLAQNPYQRKSYTKCDIEAAAVAFPALTIGQVRSVANVTWGARNRPETSLFVTFCLDSDAVVWERPALARAVSTYQGRMFGVLPMP